MPVIPSFVGLLVLGVGLTLIYVGLHGGGFLTVVPRAEIAPSLTPGRPS